MTATESPTAADRWLAEARAVVDRIEATEMAAIVGQRRCSRRTRTHRT